MSKVFRNRALIILIILFATNGVVSAQTLEPHNFAKVTDVLPPPPNAAALGKYGGIDVSLSSGSINKSMNIYTLQSGSIAVPVTLSYTSNGFKPGEMPSRAGVGWTINIGGVITRTIVGEMDEGYPKRQIPLSIAIDTQSFNFLYGASSGAWDVQPDIFSFNFCGYTGKFVYDVNDSIVFMPANNMKVEKNLFSSNWNFRITTLDGLVYYFGGNTATEKTKSEGGCGKDFGPSYRATSWYLTKIVSPLGDSVVFAYDPLLYDFPGTPSEIFYREGPYNNPDNACEGVDYQPRPCPIYSNQNTFCGSTLRVLGVLLNGISTSRGATMQFEYLSRIGSADKLYKKMSVKNSNSKTTSIFEFNYEIVSTNKYGNSYISSSKWPFLTSFSERSTDLVLAKEYQFVYYKTDSLPTEHTFSQDHWGYFNGKQNLGFVPKPDDFFLQAMYPGAVADREVDAEYAMRGLLSKIIYPTGGFDTIFYEANQFYSTFTDPPALTEVYYSATGTGNWTPVTVNSPVFTVTYQHSVRLDFRFEDNTGDGSYDPVHNKGTITVKNLTTNVVEYEKNSIPNGVNYSEVLTFYSGASYQISLTANGTAVTTYANLHYRPGSPVVFTGNRATAGLRVKRVSTFTDSAATPSIKRYYYGKSIDSLEYSSGAMPTAPLYSREISLRFACVLRELSVPQCGYRFCNYGSMQSSSLTNLNIYPSGYTYGTVIVSEGENFENGGTEYRYTVKADQGAINLIDSWDGDLIPGRLYFNDSYYNGLERFRTVYRSSPEGLFPVQRIENKYHIDSRKAKDVYGCAVQARWEWCPTGQVGVEVIESFNANLYAHQSRWIYVDTTIVTNFDETGLPAEVTYVYNHYANPEHMQLTKIEKVNSIGEVIVNEMVYPSDYGVLTGTDPRTLGVKNLQQVGVLGMPVEQITYRRTMGSSVERVLGSRFTTFKTNMPLPDTIYQLELTVPITDFTKSSNILGNVNRDSRYVKQLSFLSYDARGNLLSQQFKDAITNSYIWNYKWEYPVAEVANAYSTDIAYTSFETSDNGNWTLIGGNLNSSAAITGNRSYMIASGNSITKGGLSPSTSYTVSYWSQNGSLSVNGGSGSAGRIINGWTYYSHSISGSSGVTISTSTSALIDELRLYPAASQMVTATYDPLRGITSRCDVRGMITYYYYDGFGRLSLVRDEEGRILQKYCYNYAGEPEYCDDATVYYNTAVSDSFVRNNCLPGFQGGSILYIIPDSSFASLVSQWDANHQPVLALSAGGQGYANNYGPCNQIFYNVEKSGTFVRNNCGNAYTGSSVVYTVSAGTFNSSISQAYVDSLAQAAVNSNGQAFANTNGTCTLTCTTGNCSGNDKKCINGVCQTGIKVYTGWVKISTHLYECTYHYEWSDGSWSSNYTEQSISPCISEM